MLMEEVALHPLRLLLDTAGRSGCGPCQGRLGSCRGGCGDPLLQVGIEQLVRLQIRGIAGQIEGLDLVGIGLQPLFDQLRVMDTPIVQNQEELSPLVAGQPFQEADQDLRMQRAGEDIPAHLPLVGHRRNHAEAGAIAVDAQHRRLTPGRITALAHIVGSQPGFIAPVDLRSLLFGALGDLRIGLIEPLARRRRSFNAAIDSFRPSTRSIVS